MATTEGKRSFRDIISGWMDKLFNIADSDEIISTDPKLGLQLRGEDADLCLAKLKSKADTLSARRPITRATTTSSTYATMPRHKSKNT